MEIRCDAVARLQIVALDTVEEYANTTEVAAERSCLRRREPALRSMARADRSGASGAPSLRAWGNVMV